MENIDGPFTPVPYGEEQSASKKQAIPTAKAGYILSPKINNSFIVVNDLMKSGIQVYRLPEGEKKSGNIEPGAFYIPSSVKAQNILFKSASENGIMVSGTDMKPSGAVKVSPTRIAICNRYGGSMPAGWMSWVLEQFHFPYEMIYTQNIDSGNLIRRFDVIIFPPGAIPAFRRGSDSSNTQRRQGANASNEDIPQEYRGWTGNITDLKSIPQIKKFIESGGTAITIGSSTSLAYFLNLPVKNALSKTDNDGRETTLRSTEFYIPGSLLTADIDTLEPANLGIPSRVDLYFDQSPVFILGPTAETQGIKRLAWFSGETPLHSGWALGQKYLKDGVVAFMAPAGAGKMFAFGTDITFRSQTHSNFKFLFNQLYRQKSK
jgi:hypothetical protein